MRAPSGINLRRPSGRLRRAWTWVLWIRQGRPDFMPVVLRTGTITKCRHGYAHVEGWSWSFVFQTTGPVDAAHMVDILGAQYGVTRVSHLDVCPACNAEVTA